MSRYRLTQARYVFDPHPSNRPMALPHLEDSLHSIVSIVRAALHSGAEMERRGDSKRVTVYLACEMLGTEEVSGRGRGGEGTSEGMKLH